MNIRPAKQLWLPFKVKGELFTSEGNPASPVEDKQLMERIVDRDNLLTALRNVKRNRGSPGIDGMTVERLPEYLKKEWPKIRRQLISGTYMPLPVKRVEIPKPGGGIRELGIPTVFDRFIQQALLQVLQQKWDATFSEFSYGFRPKRSAHQAVKQSQEYLKQGYRWVLDKLDRELSHRGHRFVRYADDSNIYVRSKRAGLRVLKSITRFLGKRLKLSVNDAKSAVDRPWKRQFLGFTFSTKLNRRISEKSIKSFKERIREITCRVRGRRIETIVQELRQYMLGWQAYFGFTEVRYILKELDSWVKRRLRCYLWKQWGRRGYRELRKLGVSRDLAWNTAESAHGPWRLSRSPVLAFALPGKYFANLGLPRLFVKPT
ncbi:MAG: reverse transcriptase domain-containing protein [Pseudomonadota bacterium]